MHAYLFDHTWRLHAPMPDVFEMLRDVGGYPRWWPQVRDVRQIDERTGEVSIRSLMPVTMKVVVAQRTVDAEHGVLEAELGGDLLGRSQWTMRQTRNGTDARFRQRAELRAHTPPALEPLLRPVWVANHSWMMARGRAGLRRRFGW